MSIGTPRSGGSTQIRAVVADNNDLMRVLGRPNREQVTTRRDSLATTMEALALTNGDMLDSLLNEGAGHWLSKHMTTTQLVNDMYVATLGREASRAEFAIATAHLGEKPSKHDIADLLWSILMLPEFQLIY